MKGTRILRNRTGRPDPNFHGPIERVRTRDKRAGENALVRMQIQREILGLPERSRSKPKGVKPPVVSAHAKRGEVISVTQRGSGRQTIQTIRQKRVKPVVLPGERNLARIAELAKVPWPPMTKKHKRQIAAAIKRMAPNQTVAERWMRQLKLLKLKRKAA